jgi:hypothetical protein
MPEDHKDIVVRLWIGAIIMGSLIGIIYLVIS